MNRAFGNLLAAARLTVGDGALPDWSRIVLLQNLAGVPTTRQLTDTYLGSLGFNFMVLGPDGRPSYFCKCRPLGNARLRHELAVLRTLGTDPDTCEAVPRTWGVTSEGLQLLVSECIRKTAFDRSVVKLSTAQWVDSMREILAVESRLVKTVARALPDRADRSVVMREAGRPSLSYLASAGLLEADAVSAMDDALRLGGRVDAHPQHGDLWPQNIVGSRGAWWLLDFEAFGNVVVPLYDAWHLVRTCSDLRRRSARTYGSTPDLWIDGLVTRGDESAASWHTISVAAREYGLDSNQVIAALVYYVSHIATEFHRRGGPRSYWEPHVREARRLAQALPDLAARSYRVSHLAKGGDYDQALERDPLDAYLARRERELLLNVVSRLYPGGLHRSLDFACGTGRISQLLDGIAAQPFAVDVSATMLGEATRKCPRTTFFTQDITEAPLPIEPVELVTAFRFFGNAEDELRTTALQALWRCLVPGGYLVLNNHRNPWSVPALLLRAAGEPVPLDLHYWKLKNLLRSAGFRVRRTYGLGGWLYRARLVRPALLDSRWADAFEQVSHSRLAGPWCPDAVIVAQRMPA